MNTREKARQNEREIMTAVALNGWLTVRMIARWVYCDSELHSAINNATKAIKRLEKSGLLLKRKNEIAVNAYILTKKGTERLNSMLESEGYARGWAHHGYDVAIGSSRKQDAIVEFLAKQRKSGLAAVPQAGIRANIVDRKFLILDSLIVDTRTEKKVGVVYAATSAISTIERIQRARKIVDELVILGDSQTVKRVIKLSEQKSR